MIVEHDVRVACDAIRRRLAAVGRPDVRIVGVTKTFGDDALRAAVAAGLTDIAENYAQELVGKAACIATLSPAPTVHFIGHLQTNKVRLVVPIVDRYDTVDRPSLIAELSHRAPGARVLIQVNVSEEPSKSGCDPSDAEVLVESAAAAGLAVEGLMTIGRTGDPERAREGFRLLRSLVDRCGLSVCSMGMSDDLEVAAEEGATEIRIGSALFGQRVRNV